MDAHSSASLETEIRRRARPQRIVIALASVLILSLFVLVGQTLLPPPRPAFKRYPVPMQLPAATVITMAPLPQGDWLYCAYGQPVCRLDSHFKLVWKTAEDCIGFHYAAGADFVSCHALKGSQYPYIYYSLQGKFLSHPDSAGQRPLVTVSGSYQLSGDGEVLCFYDALGHRSWSLDLPTSYQSAREACADGSLMLYNVVGRMLLIEPDKSLQVLPGILPSAHGTLMPCGPILVTSADVDHAVAMDMKGEQVAVFPDVRTTSSVVRLDEALLMETADKRVCLYDLSGKVRWRGEALHWVHRPSIGPRGEYMLGWPMKELQERLLQVLPGRIASKFIRVNLQVLKLDRHGKVCWAHEFSKGTTSSATNIGADGRVVVACDDGYIYAFDP